jgi:hypothetical protein
MNMAHRTTHIAIGLASLSLLVVIFQQFAICDLQDRLDAAQHGPKDETTLASPAPVSKSLPPYDDRKLRLRLAALDRKITTMRDFRKAAAKIVTTRPAAPRSLAGKDDPVLDEVSSLREDVDALLTGAGVQSTEGKTEVANLLKRAREKERTARSKRWQEFRRQRDETMISEFAKDQDLGENQTEQLASIIGDMRSEQSKLWRGIRDGTMEFGTLRTKRQALKAATLLKLEQLLDADQLTLFQTKMKSRRHRGIL